MSKHTPFKAPVRVANGSPDSWYFDDVIEDADGTIIAWTRLSGTAEKFAACVNALSGIDDPAAFVEAFEEMRRALDESRRHFRILSKVDQSVTWDAMCDEISKALANAAKVKP